MAPECSDVEMQFHHIIHTAIDVIEEKSIVACLLFLAQPRWVMIARQFMSVPKLQFRLWALLEG